MKSIGLLVLMFLVQFASADEVARQKLSNALIAGSPWSFSNKHVYETQSWRLSVDGSLEVMSSYNPNVWMSEIFTNSDTIIHSSRAGGNTITYYLDSNGNAAAVHSKKPIHI